MLDKIAAGELDATPSMTKRIEGAAAVLDEVLGRSRHMSEPGE
jgi:hypothetical protein